MSLSPEDIAQIRQMIEAGRPSFASGYRPSSPMEAGSPEFAEDRTQINSLNNKYLFDAHLQRSLVSLDHGQSHYDNLLQVSLRALNDSVDLAKEVSARTVKSLDQSQVELAATNAQRARHADMWAYEQAYDLGNPVTTGAGDSLRSSADPQNRGIDTATAQSALNNTTIQTAIEASVANALNASIPVLVSAIGAAIAAALVNTPLATPGGKA